VYEPLTGADFPDALLMARLAGPPQQFLATARSAIRGIDPDLAPLTYTCLSRYEAAEKSVSQGAVIASCCGVLALILAVTGIYGLLAFSVSQRTRQIGIRIALGAERADILTTLLRQYRGPVGFGIVGGVFGGFAAVQTLRTEFVGLEGLNPAVCCAAICLFLAAACAAALIPARRAMNTDPLAAIRHD
jgi:predicted lysophospholipase L1 biosynthesis ABC-type transport system permease subunit